MTDPRVPLRNPIVAAALAFLMPGAGHLYQRRFFKAVIYFVCVLGVFFWGCSLGEAKAVHLRWDGKSRPGETRQKTLGYLAQVGVGAPALPAALQYLRYESQTAGSDRSEREPNALLESIDTEFTGRLMHTTLGHSMVTGHLVGERRVGEYGLSQQFDGTLTGTLENGKTVELKILGTQSSGELDLGPRICGLDNVTLSQLDEKPVAQEFSADRRRFYCRVVEATDPFSDAGMIEGTIPRSWVNHFEVPLTDEAMQYLNGKLGKQYELALVYTWIAGLLNLLAVWDAAQGPAYGYGDEEDGEASDSAEARSSSASAASDQPATAPANV
ncbi:hypothetical protein GC176_23555 [bacterium]|nr:hypothetical protein [bacterium]